MRVKTTLAALAAATVGSLAMASSANAALTALNACSDSQLTGTGFVVDGCSGWWSGNLDGGSAAMNTDAQTAIDMLPGISGFTGTGLFNGNFAASGNTITLPHALQPGIDIISFHVGGAAGQPGNVGGEGTAFFEVTVGSTPVTSLTLNVPGLSNAEIWQDGGAVPEPATWALMLFGVGAIGAAMRSSRRTALATA